MAVTLNASTSSGFVQTADTSGIIELQNNGTTKMTIGSSITMNSGGLITSGTAVSASSTSVDFTGIPSWVKRITVMFSGVSLSGTSQFLIQLGDSGGVENTGYSGGGFRTSVNTVAGANSTAGFYFANTTAAAVYSGNIIITNITGNTWVAMGLLGADTVEVVDAMGGSKTLSGALDRVRITTVNGTDTFDAGTINILYEG